MVNSFKKTILFGAAGAALFGLAACGGAEAPSSSAPAPAPQATTPQPTQAAASTNVVLAGTFSGLSDHVTLGKASIVRKGTGYELVFAGDFSLDGAPAPSVGFGKDGAYIAATSLGDLKQKTGAQSYALPASFDPNTVDEVYVWCDRFNVPLGVASLKAAAVTATATPVAKASFEGRSDHVTVGAVTIVPKGDTYEVIFADDFSLDGAPAPSVGFGKDGNYVKATSLGDLKQQTGAQSYTLPASVDPAEYNEVYVWCDRFSVPLGVAKYQIAASETGPVRSGSFQGRSDHVTVGNASIQRNGDGYKLVFEGDFSLDGAPAPSVGFGKDGKYEKSTSLGALKQQTGAQEYALPASFDPSAVDEVYIWCDRFNVPLGVASLK